MIPKHFFIFILLWTLYACQTHQDEEQVNPLTPEQALKEVKDLYREYGANPDRVQPVEGWKGKISREKFEEFKNLLRQELEMEASLPHRTREEAKALIRKRILEDTVKCQ